MAGRRGMGILQRFRDVMASNIHALLDQSEDPGKMIDRYMRTLSSDLGQVKAEAAAVMADERRAARVLEECQSEISKLHRYAEKAVQNGDDDSARRFLGKKAELSEKAEALQQAYEAAKENAGRMKQMHDKLASDIRVLEERHAALKGKLTETKVQQTMNRIGSGADHTKFGELEDKINRAYDEQMALKELREGSKDDLDELFAQYEKQAERQTAEDELAAMKKKLNKQS